jgi:hypothetical protein
VVVSQQSTLPITGVGGDTTIIGDKEQDALEGEYINLNPSEGDQE